MKADFGRAVEHALLYADRGDKSIGKFTIDRGFADLKAADIQRAPEWISGKSIPLRRRRSRFWKMG